MRFAIAAHWQRGQAGRADHCVNVYIVAMSVERFKEQLGRDLLPRDKADITVITPSGEIRQRFVRVQDRISVIMSVIVLAIVYTVNLRRRHIATGQDE